ncbi:MAG: hypothetical protein ABIG45_02755 [Bacillota bacterium]
MRNPLPAQELRRILGKQGFLRLYGQDQTLYVSDAPRRVPKETLERIQHTMREHGFAAETDSANLLCIDLQPARWKELLYSFPHLGGVPFPDDERLHVVYALARLLSRHPAEFELQPMELIRAALKQYGRKDGLIALAPQMLARCAEKLRRGEPLPSGLSHVLDTWLSEWAEEART